VAANRKWLNEVKWDDNGLVPVVVQEVGTGDLLMFAWMNREALERTVREGEAVYWSRSRRKLWHKGEESGHVQRVLEIRLDCDGDAILLQVEQVGSIACHTGRHSCFFHKLEADHWQAVDAVLKDPKEIYQEPKENEQGSAP
jgi:phosphoribosyl-AMP cyclohydrolase